MRTVLIYFLLFLFFNFFSEEAISSIIDTSNSNAKSLLTNKLSNVPSFETLDNAINSFNRKWGLNGASVAIVKDGRLVYAKGFGYAIKEKQVAATPTSSFRVASISKLITAVGIMKLVEEGKFALDDKVFGKNGILNDDKYLKVSDKRVFNITVRHLLIHEAGWHSRYGDQMFMPHYIARYLGKKLPLDGESIIEFSVKKGLHFSPGTANSYSNVGYYILGKIIERVSGLRYEDYINKHVLNPINIYGMQITSNKYENRGPNEVKYYDVPGAKKRLSIYSHSTYAPKTYEGTDYETLGAAGGWTASAAQLMRFITAIDGHAHTEDILSCKAIDSMTTLESKEKFGIGWVHSDNMGNWWRTGTLSGTSAFMMRRCDGISFAFITNTSTHRGSKFAYDIKQMMEDAIGTVSWWPSHDLFPLLLESENQLRH